MPFGTCGTTGNFFFGEILSDGGGEGGGLHRQCPDSAGSSPARRLYFIETRRGPGAAGITDIVYDDLRRAVPPAFSVDYKKN
jgi:hypothetical protein